jgi:transmembrane sensor
MTGPAEHIDEQEDIDRSASTWLVRLEEGELDPQSERDFRLWLASDRRHRVTYEAMRDTWSDIGRMPGLADLAHEISTAAEIPSHRFSLAKSGWRWAAGAAVAASLAAALVLSTHRPTQVDPQYRTDLAETRMITLPDGSSVTLGARSSLTIAYTANERRVILSDGEALFDVVHNAQRPFVVDTGTTLIRDLGTKFDINRSGNSVRVGVIEGRVEVSHSSGIDRAPVVVAEGQGVQIAQSVAQGSGGSLSPQPGKLLVTPQQGMGAWRDGRLVFDNVRLTDLVSDMNRYYAPGVTLDSAPVGELRVTASFKMSEIPAFMSALNATLPVRTERASDGAFRVFDARK